MCFVICIFIFGSCHSAVALGYILLFKKKSTGLLCFIALNVSEFEWLPPLTPGRQERCEEAFNS